MLKNKSFIVKMVDDRKTTEPETTIPATPTNSPESIAIEVVTEAAVLATTAFVIVKVVGTLCDVVKIAAYGKFIVK